MTIWAKNDSWLSPVYRCDFSCNSCRAFHCNFSLNRAAISNRTCKPASITMRFGRDGWHYIVTMYRKHEHTLRKISTTRNTVLQELPINGFCKMMVKFFSRFKNFWKMQEWEKDDGFGLSLLLRSLRLGERERWKTICVTVVLSATVDPKPTIRGAVHKFSTELKLHGQERSLIMPFVVLWTRLKKALVLLPHLHENVHLFVGPRSVSRDF